jgi:hypothetical protein
MGKWAKGHTKPKNAFNPFAGMKDLSRRFKDDITPDKPQETDEESTLRNRQAMELAKLDEEENRRIKSMFAGGGGRKLFRSARSSAGSRARSAAAPSAGGSSSAAVTSPGGNFYSGGRRTSALP